MARQYGIHDFMNDLAAHRAEIVTRIVASPGEVCDFDRGRIAAIDTVMGVPAQIAAESADNGDDQR